LKNGMARQARKEVEAVLIWSADSGDWNRPGSARIARRILSQASPGGIALMHDGGGNRSQTVAALPVIIRGLKERGYRFVTIPELMQRRYIAPPQPTNKPVVRKR
jgi:chitin deacetylase